MTDKEEILEIIQRAPDEISMEEILETLKVLSALKEAERDSEQGNVVPHEEVKEMVPQWIAEFSGQKEHSKT